MLPPLPPFRTETTAISAKANGQQEGNPDRKSSRAASDHILAAKPQWEEPQGTSMALWAFNGPPQQSRDKSVAVMASSVPH